VFDWLRLYILSAIPVTPFKSVDRRVAISVVVSWIPMKVKPGGKVRSGIKIRSDGLVLFVIVKNTSEKNSDVDHQY